MLYDVIKDLIVSAISTGIIFILRRFLASVRSTPQKKNLYSPEHLICQFYISLVCFPLFLIGIVLIPSSMQWAVYLKVCCFILAFLAFSFLAGAFDTAMAFYPLARSAKKPANDESDKDRKKKK